MPPYPEQIDLPFNYSTIKDAFQPCPPSARQPVGAGSWIIIQGDTLVLNQQENGVSLVAGERPSWLEGRGEPICIGNWRGRPLRALDIDASLPLPSPLAAIPLTIADDRLDMATLTLAGLGRQILHWERQSRHCSRCGTATAAISGTWGKRCSSCGAEHFPHIHPCAIVLVRRDDRILMTRKAEWPAGRYGLVAGFVEFGESLEECAVREVREETGILIENVRYVASQSWPFPAQLMTGFVADYKDGEIVIDRDELEDARWFSIAAIPDWPAKRSIARWIIDRFARE
jgi:NAD+ diphosphatase